MQATPAPTPADIAAQLAAETLQAHRTALQTLEKLMLHAAGALMNPTEEQKNEDPAQARNATQRLRLVMQAARDILRFGGVAPPSPGSAGDRVFGSGAHEHRKTSSDARHHSNPSSHRGRMRVPLVPVDAPTPALHSNAAQQAGNLLAAAGAATPVHLSEQSASPHGVACDTQDASAPTLLPSSVPSVSSVFQSPSDVENPLVLAETSPPVPRLTPVYPPAPPRDPRWDPSQLPQAPAKFTDEEIDLFEATLRTQDPFSKQLHQRLVQWWNYCACYTFEHPLPVTFTLLGDRDPWHAAKRALASVGERS
ncbi:MAG: hypothetical protein QM783_14780 [Phycisphaerales bacterium]